MECRTVFLAELEFRAMAFAASELEVLQKGEQTPPNPHGLEQKSTSTWPMAVLNPDIASFVDTLASYFARFGHCGGCYVDMKPYLCLLDDTRARTLMQKLEALPDLHSHALQQAEDGEVDEVEVQCQNAQRRLNLARLRHGLRLMEGASLKELGQEGKDRVRINLLV
eukprot:TRINITY_DN31956_c0_g1_i2.p1 TRINITY_DN31956_c0_g1~~TRINITY_DN31956_c0_g1_i2.p1  ORF type:complete len:167 (-),score=26.06 TRINITY_DN31956_c0_g1_i2:98-598(-)